MRHFLILIFLIVASIFDLKTLEVPDVFFILIMLCAASFGKKQILAFLIVAIIYVAFVLAVSLANRQVPIGMADAKIFAALAFSLGLQNAGYIFAFSSIISGIYAAFLLISKRQSKDYAFAYVPFITAGTLVLFLELLLQNKGLI